MRGQFEKIFFHHFSQRNQAISLMKLKDNQKIKNTKVFIKTSMLDYMNDADVNYTEEDIEECITILNDHLDGLEKIKTKSEAKKLVEETVLDLNDLNDDCDGDLIETDQRENICEIIIYGGFLMGFNDEDEDVTEEWREW